MRVIRSLGLGLDECALAAVGQWEFQPGEREGKPVSVAATIEVSFRLLPGRAMEPGWYLKRVVFHLPDGVLRPAITESPYLPARLTGPASATVRLSIDEQGFPSAARLENSSDADSGAGALAIVRRWQFSPAMRNGAPVAVTATFELVFGSPEEPPAPARSRTTL
jgi:TonB family protein